MERVITVEVDGVTTTIVQNRKSSHVFGVSSVTVKSHDGRPLTAEDLGSVYELGLMPDPAPARDTDTHILQAVGGDRWNGNGSGAWSPAS